MKKKKIKKEIIVCVKTMYMAMVIVGLGVMAGDITSYKSWIAMLLALSLFYIGFYSGLGKKKIINKKDEQSE